MSGKHAEECLWRDAARALLPPASNSHLECTSEHHLSCRDPEPEGMRRDLRCCQAVAVCYALRRDIGVADSATWHFRLRSSAYTYDMKPDYFLAWFPAARPTRMMVECSPARAADEQRVACRSQSSMHVSPASTSALHRLQRDHADRQHYTSAAFIAALLPRLASACTKPSQSGRSCPLRFSICARQRCMTWLSCSKRSKCCFDVARHPRVAVRVRVAHPSSRPGGAAACTLGNSSSMVDLRSTR